MSGPYKLILNLMATVETEYNDFSIGYMYRYCGYFIISSKCFILDSTWSHFPFGGSMCLCIKRSVNVYMAFELQIKVLVL